MIALAAPAIELCLWILNFFAKRAEQSAAIKAAFAKNMHNIDSFQTASAKLKESWDRQIGPS